MKLSKLRKVAPLALAMLALATSCSYLKVPDDVSIKAVPIDLTFGVAKEKTGPQDRLPTPVAPSELPTLPPDDKPPEEDPDPPELCPPLAELGAREAPKSIERPDHEPREGKYLHLWAGNFDGREQFFTVGLKDVSQVFEDPEANAPNSFYFTVDDNVVGMKYWFQVRPIAEGGDQDPSDLPGLYLKRLDLRPNGQSDKFAFIPASPLRLAGFPFVEGTTERQSAPDIAPKNQLPIPGLPQPTANTIISEFQLGRIDTIQVCAKLARAFSVNWKIEIHGEFEHELFGTFWFQTGMGGWPIREQYTMLGDQLVAGNFESYLLNLDPLKYA